MTETRKKRILIVDDDPGVLHLLESRLAHGGEYEARTVLDSYHAMPVAKEFHPDIILLDVMIPDKSGGELALDLRRDPETRQIPIVFMSVLIEDHGKKRLEIEGEQFRVVAKPLYFPELLSALRKTLNEARAGRSDDPVRGDTNGPDGDG